MLLILVIADLLYLCAELTQIMGDRMEDSTWKQITHHARFCASPLDKLYAYRAADTTIYMNSIFDLAKVEFGGKDYPLQEMDEAQKVSPPTNCSHSIRLVLVSCCTILFFVCVCDFRNSTTVYHSVMLRWSFIFSSGGANDEEYLSACFT